MKRLFNKPKLDLEIKQVPTIVNCHETRECDLILKATAIVCSTHPLHQESLQITFSGERVTPVPTPLFSISPSEQTKRALIRDTKRVSLASGKLEGGVYRYEAPVEFQLPETLPGTLSPLSTGSSSIRYYLNASFQNSLGWGPSCSKEIHMFRACRGDWTDLDTFVDNTGSYNDSITYEVWSMKSILCGGQARFQVTVRSFKEDMVLNAIRVTLKERQLVKVPTPAMHQSRPGETTTLAATFSLAERVINVPQCAARTNVEKTANVYGILFDLSLPESTKLYRRSSTKRGGIALEHYFDIELMVSDSKADVSPINLRSDTRLALPVDFEHYVPHLKATDPCQKRLLVLPPAYEEFAPPGYGPHKIDMLYKGGETVVESSTDEQVIFL